MAPRPALYVSTSGPCNRDFEKQKTLRGLALKRRSHIKKHRRKAGVRGCAVRLPSIDRGTASPRGYRCGSFDFAGLLFFVRLPVRNANGLAGPGKHVQQGG